MIALTFGAGATQLRFGDDFGLSRFKRELRRLLPNGIEHWRRNFGNHVSGGKKDEDEDGEGGEGDGADEVEEEEEGGGVEAALAGG